MNAIRYGVIVVVIILLAVYGYFWTAAQKPAVAPPPDPVAVQVLSDGAVVIDGETFSDPAKLRAKWATVRARHPDAFADLVIKGADAKALGKAVTLLGNAGIISMGISKDPKPVPGH